jgi:hypothetical protein
MDLTPRTLDPERTGITDHQSIGNNAHRGRLPGLKISDAARSPGSSSRANGHLG